MSTFLKGLSVVVVVVDVVVVVIVVVVVVVGETRCDFRQVEKVEKVETKHGGGGDQGQGGGVEEEGDSRI